MYVGCWNVNKTYNRGDIVYILPSEYYICALNHTSDDIMFPTKEDIYWINISVEFLHQLMKSVKNNKDDEEEGGEEDNDADAERRYEQNQIKNKLKRKIRLVEYDLKEFKKRKLGDEFSNLREKLLLMKLDMNTKSFLIDKFDNCKNMSSSDSNKHINWLKTVSSIPFGKYKNLKIKMTDSSKDIQNYLKNIKSKLDKTIYGLEDVKQEILEFIARKITNPFGKGHVLALCGPPGVGKTKIIKSLANALELPFFQINFGGLNDASILTGHSETYVGSKPGKIVEILSNSQYMNPIIYMDEIDKVSESKSREIFGILTHLLDEEQNDKFQDNYLSNVNINLSKVLFVMSFNDVSKVDEITSDRMKIIYINSPSLEDKLTICQDKMISEIIKTIKFKNDTVIDINKELLEYIINIKTHKEHGVRQLKKNIERISRSFSLDTINNLNNFNKFSFSHLYF